MAGWHRSRPPWQAASRRLADHGASGMRAEAYRGYARQYGRNRRARHRNRGRAASAQPRRADPDRYRRHWPPHTPRGHPALDLHTVSPPHWVELNAHVRGTSRVGKLLPEGWQTMVVVEGARRHTEVMLGTTVEIGEHAIAIEEELHQPNLAGMIRIGTGASSGRQPRAAITSLLWTALRPRLRSSDQVM